MAMRRRDAVSEMLNLARISPTDVARSQIQGSRSRHSSEVHDGFLSLARASSRRRYDLLLVFVSKVKATVCCLSLFSTAGNVWRRKAKAKAGRGALAAAVSRPCALDRQVADVTHESRQEPTKT